MAVTSAAFWDRVAPSYSKQAIADGESYARKLAATQALLEPGMRMLELGCGTGSTALEHALYVEHIEATDLSAEMIAIGREKARAAGIHNVTFRQTSIEAFEEAHQYDVVLALNLIHLLPNRAEDLAKIHRLLKSGGLFISSTVCLADRMWYLRPVIPIMQWLGKAPYVEFLRAESVRSEISDAGFDIQEQWTHGRANSLFLIARKH